MRGTAQVLDGLRREGWQVTYSYLAWLIRDRIFDPPAKGPGGARLWDEADVRRLRSELRRRGRYRDQGRASAPSRDLLDR